MFFQESKDEDLEKIVRLYSDLDLTRPMPNCPRSQHRYLLYEGDLRLRDLNNSKVSRDDRHRLKEAETRRRERR